jgi:hypothetical protein
MLYPVFQTWRRSKDHEAKPTATQGVVSPWEAVFALIVVAFFAWTLWEAREWWFRSRLFPWTIGFAGLALALLQFRSELAGLARSRGARREENACRRPTAIVRQRTLAMTAWILGFFAAIWLLGFSAAVPVTIFLYLKAGAHERWPISIALAFFGWLCFYGIFDHLLQVPFAAGQIFAWIQQVT